ncbi:MAG: arginine N-succinyltransferase [Myxococcota bacterium]
MIFRKPSRPKKRVAPGRSPSEAKHKSGRHEPVEGFIIREAQPKDLGALYKLAGYLDSVNLPANKEVLKAKIKASRDGFAAKTPNPFAREYLFVLEGEKSGRIAGTSMLFAQHGTSEAPHIYFDVINDERYSITLDRHFSHLCLRLGFNYRGPTEIGGLVLDPALRSFGLGKQLSYVRFLFIAMFRSRFRGSVIAELMPPLLEDGRSELWEYLGRHFVGLSYQEADKLSQTNKEFITALFPQTPIYASLLPKEVQAKIGEVGEETKGVRKMLESIGFEYSGRIDPFDGGPHFEATTDDISVIRAARLGLVDNLELPEEEEQASGEDAKTTRVMVGAANAEGPCNFRALATRVRFHGGSVEMAKRVRESLKVRVGDNVWTMPY